VLPVTEHTQEPPKLGPALPVGRLDLRHRFRFLRTGGILESYQKLEPSRR
jgi:hypothetical protein